MAKVNPKSKRSRIADLAVQIAEHQARLQVIAANWGAEIAEHLNTTEKAFLAGLAKELKGFRFNPNAKETLDRLKKITDRLNTIRRLAYQRAEEKVREEARKLAENEAKWGKRVTKELSAPDVKLKDATPALLDKVVKFGLADGKTLQEYFSGIADADAVRVESSIRQGVESGWTIDQIARNLAGTAEGNYKDGIFETSRKSAINMARTLCNAVSNNAKDAFYNANSDVINGVEILATLDGRTCPVCAGLDRKRYPIGESHPALPVHHSCRCVLLPVTPLSDMVEEERPMAKSDFMLDAKENYKKRFPNKDFDKLSDSTKKKYYYEAMRLYEQRTGEPAYTQVAGGVSFKDYFTDYMTDEQRKKWLGPERFAIWKRGNLPLDKFIPPYPDKRLTVDALKKMDQKSFRTGTAYQASGFIKKKSVGIIADTQADFPEGYEYQPLKSYYDAAQKGEKEFIKKLREKSPEKEVIAVWDADTGKVHCVAMGVHDKVTFEFPEPNAIAIHNHPEGTTPSLQDFNIFASGRMKKMQIITKEGSFVLTSSGGGAILDIEEINKRFHKISGEERDSISFDEWEKVLEGSQYAIQNIPHRNN